MLLLELGHKSQAHAGREYVARLGWRVGITLVGDVLIRDDIRRLTLALHQLSRTQRFDWITPAGDCDFDAVNRTCSQDPPVQRELPLWPRWTPKGSLATTAQELRERTSSNCPWSMASAMCVARRPRFFDCRSRSISFPSPLSPLFGPHEYVYVCVCCSLSRAAGHLISSQGISIRAIYKGVGGNYQWVVPLVGRGSPTSGTRVDEATCHR